MKMKKLLALSLAMAMAFSVPASAAPTSIYEKNAPKPPVTVAKEKPAIGIKRLIEIGVPIVTTELPATKLYPVRYTYEGRKLIDLSVKEPGVSVSVTSENRDLQVWIHDGRLRLTSDKIKPGESVNIVVKAEKAGYESVVQNVRVTITDGSAKFPHLISEVEDFKTIKTLGLTSNYKQAQDISLSGVDEWDPIGTAGFPFEGTYDGNGHKISDMSFLIINTDNVGIFGVVSGARTVIKNVILSGKIDTDKYPAKAQKAYTDSYYADRERLAVETNNVVLLKQGSIAGFLKNGATISDSTFTGEMKLRTGRVSAGGIVGAVNNGYVKNCTFSGKINSENDYSRVGGITGELYGFIENCKVSGEIISEAQEQKLGGVVGLNTGSIKSALVKANIARYGKNGECGGIAGDNLHEVYESAFSGKMDSKGVNVKLGGIAGDNNSTIINCYADAIINAEGQNGVIGGIVGQNDSGTVTLCGAAVQISTRGDGDKVGGIAGYNYSVLDSTTLRMTEVRKTEINSCTASGSIRASGDDSSAGGITAANYGFMQVYTTATNQAEVNILNCAAKMDSISALHAGRITASNKLLLLVDKTAGIMTANVRNNIALETTVVNGKTIAESTSESDVNGRTGTAEQIAGFEESYVKQPIGRSLLN